MKSKNVNEYRDEVMTHLEYIKEKVNENHSHLQKINCRLRSAENSITAIKTIGSTITVIISIVLTWFGIKN